MAEKGSVRAFFSTIWRWTPLALSFAGTAGITIGTVVLGSGDYSSLAASTKVWGWSLVGGGIVLGLLAAVILARRELARGVLRGKLESANGRAARAEDLVGALSRALQEGMRSRLMQIEADLEIKPGVDFRTSLYSHNKRDGVLVRRARFSRNHQLDDASRGRTEIPEGNGLLGRALTKSRVSIESVSVERSAYGSTRPTWESWMVTHGNLTSDEAAKVRMESYLYMFAPITDPSVARPVGILVVEFLNPKAAPPAAKLRDSIARRGRDLAVALAAIERELELSASKAVRIDDDAETDGTATYGASQVGAPIGAAGGERSAEGGVR